MKNTWGGTPSLRDFEHVKLNLNKKNFQSVNNQKKINQKATSQFD